MMCIVTGIFDKYKRQYALNDWEIGDTDLQTISVVVHCMYRINNRSSGLAVTSSLKLTAKNRTTCTIHLFMGTPLFLNLGIRSQSDG